MLLLARAVFLALVGATFGAFFVAQELKSRPAVVDVNTLTRFFSPDGDGAKDFNKISVVVQESDDLTLGIVDADGDEVRRLLSAVPARAYRPVRTVWDGRTDTGARAPDGAYRLRIGLRDQGRSVVFPRTITLDTTPPTPLVRRGGGQDRVVAPGRDVRFTVRGASGRRAPRVRLWRTDVAPAEPVAELRARRGRARVTWDGLVDGAPAPPGTYMAVATVRDRSGNVGSSAPGLPELPAAVRGEAGVTVRALGVQPPSAPIRAGRRAEFFVDARGREYRWRIRRVGARNPVSRGTSREARLRVPAPRGVSGAYLLELRSGRHATAVPFLVQAAERAPLLVVLPAITWLGREPADEDGDGLPDTLARGGPAPLARVYDDLPVGFGEEVAPLLIFLDRARLRYDLTTDVALAGSRDPRPTDRDGVLLAGPMTWITAELGARLREYVAGGGRVAGFGTDSLRRGVVIRDDALVQPTAPAAEDAFGARLQPVRPLGGAPLEPIADEGDLDLFLATDGVLTGFSRVQEARIGQRKVLAGLGEQVSEREAAAAEEEGTPVREPLPALEGTRTGRGVVVRVGLPEWPQRLFEDPEVAQVHRNILDVLRGVQPKPRSALL